MTTIAYVFNSSYHCEACTLAKLGKLDGSYNARGETIGAVFGTDDLRSIGEDGIYCDTCGACLYLPDDLRPLDNAEIFAADADQVELCQNWHSGQSSMFYAIASTGSLTIHLAPKTPRQAYAMLTDLLSEVDRVENSDNTTATEYVLALRFAEDVLSARREYDL